MNSMLLMVLFFTSFTLSAQTCESQVKSIDDLFVVDNLENAFNKAFPSANDAFQARDYYFLVYKDAFNSTLIFMGTGHSKLMSNKGQAINKHLIKTIKELKKSRDIKVIIVETNDAGITLAKTRLGYEYCPEESCTSSEKANVTGVKIVNRYGLETSQSGVKPVLSPKKSILVASEIEAAMWTGLKEEIELKGGEPTIDDFKKIFKLIGLSEKDFWNYKLLDRLGQFKQMDSKTDFSLTKAYEDVVNSDPSLDAYKGSQQMEEYYTWLKGQYEKNKSLFVKRPTCTDPGSIIEDYACYNISLTEYTNDQLKSSSVDKTSVLYTFGMIHRIKNFCLIKNIQASLKKGNVLVVYGAAHLKNTYQALTAVICPTTKTEIKDPCPLESSDM